MKNKNFFLASTVAFLSFFVLSADSALATWSATSVASYGLPSGTVTAIIGNILLWLLYMLGIVGVIGFVVSGLMYLIAAGDETLITRAKKGMTFSIVGIIVGLAGVVIIRAIDTALRGSSSIF